MMLVRKGVALFLLFSLVSIVGPVNILALDNDPPPGPNIAVLYSGNNTYGSLDITEITGVNRDDYVTNFFGPDGSAILLTQSKVTGKCVTTLPGGRIKAEPASDHYKITITSNSGQSWIVNVGLDSSSQVMFLDDGAEVMAQAAAAIEPASADALAALKDFLLTADLVTQNSDGSLSTRPEMWNLACLDAIIGLAAATYYAMACPMYPPSCPILLFFYLIALHSYYNACDPGHRAHIPE